MTLLGQAEAKDLVKEADAGRWRVASYDATIGTILPCANSDRALTELELKPQGMAYLVSKETVSLPKDVLGYAMIKTGDSERGLLAINIGIVDPGFSGPLASIIINFSNRTRLLKTGDPFLRLTFHRFDPQGIEPPEVRRSLAETVAAKSALVAALPLSFLDSEATTEKIAGTLNNRLLWGAGIIGLVVTVQAVLIPLALSWFDDGVRSKAPLVQQLKEQQKEIDQLRKLIAEVRGGAATPPAPAQPVDGPTQADRDGAKAVAEPLAPDPDQP